MVVVVLDSKLVRYFDERVLLVVEPLRTLAVFGPGPSGFYKASSSLRLGTRFSTGIQ